MKGSPTLVRRVGTSQKDIDKIVEVAFLAE
jgi:hypothetical protein